MRVYSSYERRGELRHSAFAVTPDGKPIDFTFTVRDGKLRPITVHKVKRSRRKHL
jgi:hypothetical protein